jgi:hypothetical protein
VEKAKGDNRIGTWWCSLGSVTTKVTLISGKNADRDSVSNVSR